MPVSVHIPTRIRVHRDALIERQDSHRRGAVLGSPARMLSCPARRSKSAAAIVGRCVTGPNSPGPATALGGVTAGGAPHVEARVDERVLGEAAGKSGLSDLARATGQTDGRGVARRSRNRRSDRYSDALGLYGVPSYKTTRASVKAVKVISFEQDEPES